MQAVPGVDYSIPHPDFILNPTKQLSNKECANIVAEMKEHEALNNFGEHALMVMLFRISVCLSILILFFELLARITTRHRHLYR